MVHGVRMWGPALLSLAIAVGAKVVGEVRLQGRGAATSQSPLWLRAAGGRTVPNGRVPQPNAARDGGTRLHAHVRCAVAAVVWGRSGGGSSTACQPHESQPLPARCSTDDMTATAVTVWPHLSAHVPAPPTAGGGTTTAHVDRHPKSSQRNAPRLPSHPRPPQGLAFSAWRGCALVAVGAAVVRCSFTCTARATTRSRCAVPWWLEVVGRPSMPRTPNVRRHGPRTLCGNRRGPTPGRRPQHSPEATPTRVSGR